MEEEYTIFIFKNLPYISKLNFQIKFFCKKHLLGKVKSIYK